MDTRPFCDPQEADRLARSVLPFAYHLAAKAATRHCNSATGMEKAQLCDDFGGVACEAVARALTKFDPTRGVKFITYAGVSVIRALQSEVKRLNKERRKRGMEVRLVPGDPNSEHIDPDMHPISVADYRTSSHCPQTWKWLLKQLPEKRLRLIADMKWRLDMENTEIAREMARRGRLPLLSRERVRQLLQVIRKRLRTRLEGVEF